ncbi:MAG TPA: hypothetical protein VJZ93_02605 [Candidatus Nanoarchaeia archaeon]|nr:hypothetical protein [Candidatus Nanoarchaeia archaeon]
MNNENPYNTKDYAESQRILKRRFENIKREFELGDESILEGRSTLYLLGLSLKLNVLNLD